MVGSRHSSTVKGGVGKPDGTSLVLWSTRRGPFSGHEGAATRTRVRVGEVYEGHLVDVRAARTDREASDRVY